MIASTLWLQKLCHSLQSVDDLRGMLPSLYLASYGSVVNYSDEPLSA